MFETSIEERMGRSLSLLGLARAHSMLGNDKEADYFYKYLRTQLKTSDKNNPMVKEAENWVKLKKSKSSEAKSKSESSYNSWFWPFLL